MTREEEITEKAEKFADSLSDGLYFKNGPQHRCRKHGFIQGAKWSDEHPRKELWDADKVCRVFKDYMLKNHFFDNRIERTAIIDNIICDLRKAMEE